MQDTGDWTEGIPFEYYSIDKASFVVPLNDLSLERINDAGGLVIREAERVELLFDFDASNGYVWWFNQSDQAAKAYTVEKVSYSVSEFGGGYWTLKVVI